MKTLCTFCFLIVVSLPLPGHTNPDNVLPMVTVEFPPFAFADSRGYATGASTQVVAEALAQMGYRSFIDILPTKRAQQMTIKGAYSALFPLTKSAKRESYCLLSDPISYIVDVFFKRKSDAISWERLDDLERHIVGATDGYNYANVFLDAVRRNVIKVDLIASRSPELQHLKKLVNSRIDLAICERSVCTHLLNAHRPEFDSLDFIPKPIGPIRSFRVCFSRKWPGAIHLVSQFNRALERMRVEGKFKAIMDRYGIIDTTD